MCGTKQHLKTKLLYSVQGWADGTALDYKNEQKEEGYSWDCVYIFELRYGDFENKPWIVLFLKKITLK